MARLIKVHETQILTPLCDTLINLQSFCSFLFSLMGEIGNALYKMQKQMSDSPLVLTAKCKCVICVRKLFLEI